jgi:hypothetical protein
MTYREPTNEDRASWAEVAVEAFKKETRMEGEDLETCMGDLLCDLRHLADAEGLSWDGLLHKGDMHYRAERGDQ